VGAGVGGIEDVAQALQDAPEIQEKIRVYWIGGPNKKWSINAYAYLAGHHPDLWMIEANATYRGWFMDAESPKNLTGKAYYGNYIQDRGAMGKDFINYYKGELKMGNSPPTHRLYLCLQSSHLLSQSFVFRFKYFLRLFLVFAKQFKHAKGIAFYNHFS
jgi:hypothetical protein